MARRSPVHAAPYDGCVPLEGSSPEVVRDLTGWGLAKTSSSRVSVPARLGDVGALLSSAADGVIARGCGRSYGDAAQLDGGSVLDMTGLSSVLSFDGRAGLVEAEAGVTLRQLQHMLVGAGWSLAVVPGTQEVTVGGAIAADVHGKSHEVDGSFSRHVAQFRLALPTGEVAELDSPDDDLWRATVGGMGLTGVILSAVLRLRPITGSLISVDTQRTTGLDETLAALADDSDGRRYSVAWIDALAAGQRRGRGIVTKGDNAAVPGRAPRYGRGRAVRVPELPVPSFLRPSTVGAFNELNWRHAPRSRRDQLVEMERFFFPLDSARDWNRLYGSAGFYQYQFVVPPPAVALVARSLELLAREHVPVYLAILKRFGPADSGYLSFPMPGWTLALDLPASAPRALAAMDELDEMVASEGGRVYLAKDLRLGARHVAAMYPQLETWREAQARADPNGLMRSDLSVRLGLTAGAPGRDAQRR